VKQSIIIEHRKRLFKAGMKIVRISILIFLILSVGNSSAQPNFPQTEFNLPEESLPEERLVNLFKNKTTYTEGFIVTNNNDTISCLIKDVSRESSCTMVYTKNIKTAKKRKYGPSVVKYYKRGSEEFYSIKRKTPAGNILTFIMPVIKGEVTLFIYYYIKGGGYDGTPSQGFGVGTEAQHYYLYREGGLGFRPSGIGFKNKVGKYFQDYPALSERIKNKELRKKNLQEIVRLYNNWHRLGRPENMGHE